MHGRSPVVSLLSLLLICSIASFAAVFPSASIPAIAHYFGVTSASAESIMSLFLVGYAIGQLIWGPVSNHIGRRKTLIWAMSWGLVANILSILAFSWDCFDLLVVSRILTALGLSAGIVVGMTIITDLYSDHKAREVFSSVLLAFSAVPFIAIALGGWIGSLLGNQSLFYLMELLIIGLLVISMRLPETRPLHQKVVINGRSLVMDYIRLFQNGSYLRLVIIFGLMSSTIYVFNSVAPVLIISKLHLSSQLYGLLSIIPAVAILVGSYLSKNLAHKVTANILIRAGVVTIIIASLLLCVIYYIGFINVYTTFGIVIFIITGAALAIPNASMQALSYVTNKGVATALMNGINLGLCSLLVAITGGYISMSALALPCAMFFIGIVATSLSAFSPHEQADV